MKMQPIITLTTDYGLQDYYVAALKGQLLYAAPNAQLVDVSHLIPPHDMVKAAYMLKNAYKSFPTHTLHIVDVNMEQQERNSLLLACHQEQYFLLPDNGILSLLFDQLPTTIFRLLKTSSSYPSLLKLYAKVAKIIAKGDGLTELGELTREVRTRISLQPVITTHQIRASVVHIDRYENVIINVHRALFEEVGHGRNFQLFFKRHHPIRQLSNNYEDVSVGDILCRFNSTNYLEIAVCMGKAATLLSLQLDDMVQIDFQAA